MDVTVNNFKHNPIEDASFLSSLFYLYMFPIFLKGYKKSFKENDLLEPLNEHKSKYITHKLETTWFNFNKINTKNSLLKSLVKIFGYKFLCHTILLLLYEMMLILVVPAAIENLVRYFDNTQASKIDAYLNGCIFILTQVIGNVVWNTVITELALTTIQMQTACTALIYRKLLRLNQSVRVTTGQVITLMSNDVAKFDRSLMLLPQIPVAFLVVIAATFILYDKVKISAFPGVAVLIIFICLQILLGKLSGNFWKRIPGKTEQRIRRLAEYVSGVQVIKMFCWEEKFLHLISTIRRKEIQEIRQYLTVIASGLVITSFSVATVLAAIIWSEIWQEHPLSPANIYNTASLLVLLRNFVVNYFNIAVIKCFEVYISIGKIEAFLCLDEQNKEEKPKESSLKPTIRVENVSAKWSPSHGVILEDIDFCCSSSQLVAVIGAVGCGKSSLLNLLIDELKPDKGELWVNGKISYCCQNPCFFPGTVRENIVFYEKFDKERYQKVVQVCALESDLKSFSFGDQTLIRDYGKSLSGGQRSRINLARCVYRQADIYLLDDVLSAVDGNVSNFLFQKCVKDFLKDKICILVTHRLQYLKSVDRIVLMEDGKVLADGPYERLEEEHSNLLQSLTKSFTENKSETRIEDERCLLGSERETAEKESINKGKVKWSLYKFYFSLAKGWYNVFGFIGLLVVSRVFILGSDYYLAYWLKSDKDYVYGNTSAVDNFSKQKIYSSFYTYLTIVLFSVFFLITQELYLMKLMTVCSKKLHQLCLFRLFHTTMDFFSKNTCGIILNRFSEDVRILDQYLPIVFHSITQVFADTIGLLIIAFVVDIRQVLPVIFFLTAALFFKFFYINTHRDVKRIERTTRSPIYNQVVYSTQSLCTIRAYNVQENLIQTFSNHQDINTSAKFLLEVSNKAFAFWTDMLCSISTMATVLILFHFKDDFVGADIGLLLTQYLRLVSAVQWGLRQWGEAETEAVSLERLHEYTTNIAEPNRKESAKLSSDWPQFGKIEFRNVSLKYDSKQDDVLKDVSFLILPKEKIGIVGRTGSGKTSLIASLFQLFPTEGRIFIDDVDIRQIPIEKLRSKISIIPQEPFLFSGSLRENLDPFGEYSDDTLWDALEQVELKNVIRELPSGLHCDVSEGGSNFSSGQKQLICLSRALVKNNKILIMDEATANVDSHTDEIIQKSVRKRFVDCTVLTIAHRLENVLDSDKIMVMNEGRVEEFGSRDGLLENKNKIFYKLAQSGGKHV